MAAYYVRFLALVIPSLATANTNRDIYSEDLILKPIENGLVYSYFKHATVWNLDAENSEDFHHYRLFPRKLGEVLQEYSVQELHLTLTQGLWKHHRWGFPHEDAAPGAELWVWFKEDTENVVSEWKGLVNALSGMLCASLNFIDDRASVQPKYSFRPQGLASKGHAKNNSYIRYAALPNERMCTENLTPWKKLLPCGTKAGLATLMRAQRLSDTHYHSVAIHVRPVCGGDSCHVDSATADTVVALELRQTLSAVFEPVLNPARRTHDWSLHSLFGRAPGAACAVAAASRILVDVSANAIAEWFVLQPQPAHLLDMDGRQHAVYDVTDGLSLSVKYKQPMIYRTADVSPVSAHRIITGYGQESGGIRCQLNNNMVTPVTVVYMEVVPWFLRLYYHTLSIESDGKIITPKAIHYVPGRDRERPHHVEVVFTIPANSSSSISMQFDRLLLKWTEYPPDANHGFYIPSAIMSAVLPACAVSGVQCSGSPSANETKFVRLHTESLLLSLPTPDFSMPYNVICLTCTAVAIAFGSLHNLTTKSFAAKPKNAKGRLQSLKNYLMKLLGRESMDVAQQGMAGNVLDATPCSSIQDPGEQPASSADVHSPSDSNRLNSAGDG